MCRPCPFISRGLGCTRPRPASRRPSPGAAAAGLLEQYEREVCFRGSGTSRDVGPSRRRSAALESQLRRTPGDAMQSTRCRRRRRRDTPISTPVAARRAISPSSAAYAEATTSSVDVSNRTHHQPYNESMTSIDCSSVNS